ncbi:putative GTPase activating protein for Arf [Novymonas esmeraldas]|uniref:GTPase activating protein for Arf n=1 Tax=Novymonas esmeraldas TaxID=1808958 RepID=A0AAW0ENA7_9TRYP
MSTWSHARPHGGGTHGSTGGYGGSSTVASSSPGARSTGVSSQQLQRFEVLLRRPENRECFDCGAKQPRWASTNLGIFFCLRCAGIHRSMGTHISKVKSTNMDAWEESMMVVMEHIGNTRGRLLYEYNMPDSARVTSATDTAVVERAIRAKYERKTYQHPRFAQMYAQFMETAIEGSSGNDAAPQAAVATGGALAAPPGLSAPPRRAAAPGQTPARQSEELEALWGAPVVSSPNTAPSATQSAGGTYTNVAELFSSAYGPSAWGSTVATPSSASPVSAHRHNSSASNNSDWFGAQFGVADPLGGRGGGHSGAPSPATPVSRANTDDLFTTTTTTTTTAGGGATQEILSLFGTAPVAGAGGQPAMCPTAWQPQTTRPYYYPE